MNEQATLVKALSMLALLSHHYGYSVRELAEKNECTERTVRRYLRTFREAGYVIGNRRGLYHIDRERTRQRLGIDPGELLFFTREEAEILNAAISSIEASTDVRENLIRRLYSFYDDERIIWKAARGEEAGPARIIIDAIRNKRQVKIAEYTHSTANRGIREILVEPLGFAFSFTRVWAYVHYYKRNMVMRLSGIAGIKATDNPFRHEERHQKGLTDPFRGYGFETRKVRIEMNTRAYGLMIDEFPLTRQYISADGRDGDYVLETEVCNYREIGRFLLGLPDSIIRIEPDDLRQYVRDMHRLAIEPGFIPAQPVYSYPGECVWEF